MRTLSTRCLSVLSRPRLLATALCVATAFVGFSLIWPTSAEADPFPTPLITELNWRHLNGFYYEAYGDTVNCTSNVVNLSGLVGGSGSINPDGTFAVQVFTTGPFPGQLTATSWGYGKAAQMSSVVDDD